MMLNFIKTDELLSIFCFSNTIHRIIAGKKGHMEKQQAKTEPQKLVDLGTSFSKMLYTLNYLK